MQRAFVFAVIIAVMFSCALVLGYGFKFLCTLGVISIIYALIEVDWKIQLSYSGISSIPIAIILMFMSPESFAATDEIRAIPPLPVWEIPAIPSTTPSPTFSNETKPIILKKIEEHRTKKKTKGKSFNRNPHHLPSL